MKGAIVREAGGPDVIRVETLPEPGVGAGEVRVRVAYAALNPLDTHARANRVPWMHPGFPFTPGFEYAGLVDAVGEGVDPEWVGVRVAVNGTWGGNAEYAVAPATSLERVPEGFDWRTAAVYSTCAYTSWLLVHSAARVRPGQSVAIHSAAGAVGLLTTQVAKTAGATVIALAGGEAKLDYARRFGADHFVDYTRADWPEKVLEATGGRGADVVIDGNAGPHAARNLDAVARLGQIIYMGQTAGPAKDIPVSALIGKSCSVTGFVQYAHQAVSGGAEVAAMREKLASGEWRIPVEKVYALDDVAEAHRAWEARELVGRTLIECGGEL